jgi:hypothetical protein
VVADLPPVARMLNPADGDSAIAGSIITLLAAADDDVGVSEVSFVVDGEAQNVDYVRPYSYVFHVPDRPGQTIELRAAALDTKGQYGLSPAVRFLVKPDLPPEVEIDRPFPGEVLFEVRFDYYPGRWRCGLVRVNLVDGAD